MASDDLDLLMSPSPFLGSLGIPHLDQYFGVWAVEEDHFRAMADRVNRMDLRMHVEQSRASDGDNDEPRRSYRMTKDGVAVISITGTMTKYGSSLSSAGSTVAVRRSIRSAAAADDVRSILLVIDSPGGTVAGTQDLAADVAAANEKKPVTAYIEDLGASAAYWVASQAKKIFANPTALVGSIGTFAVVEDSSGMAAQAGIKVHIVRAGEFKGTGVPGTEVTHEQLDELQKRVEELNEHFIRGVAAGRRMGPEKASSLADGRVHLADAAVALGLIDGVQSLDATLAQLSAPKRRTSTMAENITTDTQAAAPVVNAPKAATYAELKASCVGADAGFICAQLENSATVAQAQAAWMAEQQKRIEAANAKAAEAEAKAAEAAAKSAVKPVGVEPLGTAAKEGAKDVEASADPVAEWDSCVRAEVAKGRTRAQAISNVAKADPDLHQAYIDAYNLAHDSARTRN